jgi:mono/diheme cytochrome c family protein
MAAWTQRLTDDQDIEAVVHYVRSLYEGGN